MDILKIILLTIGGFLFAAVPWGLVLGRMVKGIDVRKYGSGATGTTNSLRTLGWKIAVAVLLLDLFKGFAPVMLAKHWGLPTWVAALTAICVTAGHCWSPYIRFKGGKGMATGGGAAVAIYPPLVLFGLVLVIVVAITRYVSLGSLAMATLGPIVAFVLAGFDVIPFSWAWGVLGLCSIIIWQHRSNIVRLVKGTERKFGQNESTLKPS